MNKKTKWLIIYAGGCLSVMILLFFIYLFVHHPVLVKPDTVSKNDLKKEPALERMIFFDGSDLNYVRFVERKSYCSRYVAMAYNRLFNPWWIPVKMDLAVYDGIYGDAWNLPHHIKKLGGAVYKVQQEKIDEKFLKTGDIIAFYYPVSRFNEMARNAGENFTHVGLVVGFIKKRAVVVHHYVSPFLSVSYSDRVDYLDKITFFKPVAIMRTWRVESR